MPATPIAEIDFINIKNDLKAFLKGQSLFKDYDFEGSSMSVLLDVLAYNTFNQNFYANMAISEMFLDSAQLRSSIISHAKELNYLPKSYTSATSTLVVSFTPSDDPSFITIPKGTSFTGTTDEGLTLTFTTAETYVITPVEGEYIGTIDVFEGTIFTEFFEVNADTKYVLNNTQVDTGSIEVKVFSTAEETSPSEEYVFSSSLFGATSTSKVFYLQGAENNKYEITFGRNMFGREPEVNEIVEVTYRISSGISGNGATNFGIENAVDGYVMEIESFGISEGGSIAESNEDIKFFAPKAIQIQERAVTESDYEILLKNRFPEIQAISVYGGEELTPPQFGKVVIAVDVNNAEGVSINSKTAYANFLADKTPLTIEPLVISPEFIHAQVTSTIYVNRSINTKSLAQIQNQAHNAILTFSDRYLNKFKSNLRYSRLIRAIDDSDPSIVSNDTELLMIIDIIPILGTSRNFVFNFKNPLIVDHPLTPGEDINVHKPAIKSSGFTYDDTENAYIQDNGKGILQVISNNTDGFIVLNSNIGSVEYDTGMVTVSNFTVNDFDGEAIKIYARGLHNDILGIKDRILSIRASDINLTVEAAS